MEQVRQKHALPNKVIAVMLTIAMVFSVLTGIVPGTSITAEAAGQYLSDYTAGETIGPGNYFWSKNYDGKFTIVLKGGGHVDPPGFPVDSDVSISDSLLIIGNDEFVYGGGYPYDGTSTTSTWYVVGIDKEGKTVTLSGIDPSAPPPVDVSSVTLSPKTTQSITVGETIAFTAAVAPDNATNKKVIWSHTANIKLYSDQACTTEVTGAISSDLSVYAKGEVAGAATISVCSNAKPQIFDSYDIFHFLES